MISKSEVVALILNAVQTVQQASGRVCENLDASLALVGGVLGFDSLNALEVVADVSVSLDVDLDNKVFAPAENFRPVTIDEAADRILKQLEKSHDSK